MAMGKQRHTHSEALLVVIRRPTMEMYHVPAMNNVQYEHVGTFRTVGPTESGR